ncbi:ABC transporter ATP-binding protein [Pedobacter sp. UBA4863]|uniref:ABC transporter ATP-binding protein n=1 Tax=Pedobacter sp. UBA4863 TaxID=1947060 RepID=UPI0025E3F5C2|nr:ABC transporter ATP-binding protein [Pedobacter sp. UBA4863]
MKDVVLNNIVKTYNKGKVKAVNDVSFTVNKGELFGLIGPDGAGKTSIFRILTTLLLPDSGTASVKGFDVIKDYKNIRSSVGYMPGKFSLYQDLTVEENLNFFASVFNTTIQDNYDLIKDIYVQIEPFKDRRAGKLSGGMKQKLALCCALIHRPTVLFLDEPTTGVDTVSRKEFWEMLKSLKQQGITILVSTPYMDEATLCERIALMQNGEIMSIDTPKNIINQFPENLFAIKANDMGKLLQDLRKNHEIKTCNAFGEFHHITINSGEPIIENRKFKISNIEKMLIESGHKELVIKEITPTIEDCFIRLMDQSIDNG